MEEDRFIDAVNNAFVSLLVKRTMVMIIIGSFSIKWSQSASQISDKSDESLSHIVGSCEVSRFVQFFTSNMYLFQTLTRMCGNWVTNLVLQLSHH